MRKYLIKRLQVFFFFKYLVIKQQTRGIRRVSRKIARCDIFHFSLMLIIHLSNPPVEKKTCEGNVIFGAGGKQRGRLFAKLLIHTRLQ